MKSVEYLTFVYTLKTNGFKLTKISGEGGEGREVGGYV